MSRLVIVIGLLAAVIGVGTAGYGVWTIWQQHRVITSARPVKATVLAHDTKDLKASGFKSKVPLVKYEYTVDGQPYTSETVTPQELMLPPTWAEDVFKQFPVGAQAEARYDPRDPSKAFLLPKYSIYAYLPLLIGLVIAAMGVGIVGEQLTSRNAPGMESTASGKVALIAKQHHLARARLLGLLGIVGLVGGGPAILHHVMVSTSPHERMGFLMEGAFAIAVLVVLVLSALQFRQGAGFGTPVVVLNRPPAIGQLLELHFSVPTRFHGTAKLHAFLKCEAKDTSLFSFSEEKPDAVLFEQKLAWFDGKAATRGGDVSGSTELAIPEELPPSTPVDSKEKIHIVWSLTVTAEGSGGRKAETEYIVPVVDGPRDR